MPVYWLFCGAIFCYLFVISCFRLNYCTLPLLLIILVPFLPQFVAHIVALHALDA